VAQLKQVVVAVPAAADEHSSKEGRGRWVGGLGVVGPRRFLQLYSCSWQPAQCRTLPPQPCHARTEQQQEQLQQRTGWAGWRAGTSGRAAAPAAPR
jgi:hypothetical protein